MTDDKKRGRFIECRGCPTVECTCFTELEDEILEKLLFARRESITQHRKMNALIEALKWYATPGTHERWKAEEALKAFEEK